MLGKYTNFTVYIMYNIYITTYNIKLRILISLLYPNVHTSFNPCNPLAYLLLILQLINELNVSLCFIVNRISIKTFLCSSSIYLLN